MFKQYVKSAVGEDEVVFSRMDVRGLKPLPVGKIVVTPSGNRKGDIKGKTKLRLAVSVDGEACGQVTVSGWVDRYARVVFAVREIPRDTVLSADDLCLKRTNIAKAPDRLVYDIAEAVGKRARSKLQAGKYLQPHKLSEIPLIEKGDRVKLLLSAGPVSISTLGKAKADGSAGDRIRVENLSSEKTVVGRVLDASTVEVLF
jgi:flagella basal body P-ring formation protein FlgA